MSKKKATKKTVPKKTAKSSSTKKSAKKKATTKKATTKKAAKKVAKKVAKKSPGRKKTAKKVAKQATPKKTVKQAKKGSASKAVKRTAKKKSPARKQVASPAERPPTAPIGAAQPIPVAPADILLTLAERLLDNSQYHDEVRLAVESPNDYVDTFADELALRGLDAAVPSLPWIALTDGLARHGALVQLDWNFEPDDLLDALAQLPIDERGREELQRMVGYSTAEEALAAAGDRLLAVGLALVTVDNNEAEDSYPLAVISAADVPYAQRLASELGLGSIRHWSSDAT